MCVYIDRERERTERENRERERTEREREQRERERERERVSCEREVSMWCCAKMVEFAKLLTIVLQSFLMYWCLNYKKAY